jgi:hypothetical protein
MGRRSRSGAAAPIGKFEGRGGIVAGERVCRHDLQGVMMRLVEDREVACHVEATRTGEFFGQAKSDLCCKKRRNECVRSFGRRADCSPGR